MSETTTRTNGTDPIPWILQQAAERRGEAAPTGGYGESSSEAEAVTAGAGWQESPPPVTIRAFSPPPPPPPTREWDSDVETIRANAPRRSSMAPPPPPPGGRGTDGLAVTALVLGILAQPLFWVAVVGIAAVVFGMVALSRVNRDGRQGRGAAIAGVVLGSISVAAFVVLAVVAVASDDDRAKATATSPTAADGRFTATDGRFVAEFPKAPYRQEDKLTDNGLSVPLVTYGVDTTQYSVGAAYADLPDPGIPESARDELLDLTAEGAAAELDDSVIESKTDLTYLGHSALDVVATSSEGTLYARIFIVDNRVYMLLGLADDDRPAPYDRLLETFSLL